MIENGRDEDACRQMDVLAYEDHTHHLTPQEYYHFNSNWWLRSNKTGSNTVPVWRRPDLKQALSPLQQLKQKGAQRNQQWAQSSSSSWWSWQGSWWTPYSYESHRGDEPSSDRTGWLVIQVFGKILQGMILTAVYCNRRCVWIPHLKWRVFAVQKCAQKWQQGKVMLNWYSMTTRWELGHEVGKFRKMENLELSMAWWQGMTQTSMTTSMIAWHCTMRTPLATSTDIHMSVARTVSFSFLSRQRHIIRTRIAAQDVWVLSWSVEE